MRTFILLAALVLLPVSVACTPLGGAEPTTERAEESEMPAPQPATPETGDGYPPSLAPTPDGYPAAPEPAAQPTGYPEITIVVPSGEVDLGDLTPVTPETGAPQVMPSPGRPGAPSPQLAVMLEAITRDLSAQTDTPIDEIAFVVAEPMTWPNTGLGCPAPGVAYAEMLVEGMRITLEAAGQAYAYHTDGGRNFVLCIDGEPVSSGVVPR